MSDDVDTVLELVEVEYNLTSPFGPVKIRACKRAYELGKTVEEISEISGIPMWRVRQAVLAPPPRPND